MSIPIAARRYIAELGISDLGWQEDSARQLCRSGFALLIIDYGKKCFGIEFAKLNPDESGLTWLFASDFGWDVEQHDDNVVCWSEIKI